MAEEEMRFGAAASPSSGQILSSTEVLDRLNINNQLFRDTFREFDIAGLAKATKTPSIKGGLPVTLLGSHVTKRPALRT